MSEIRATTNSRARRKRAKMPFAIEQSSILTASFFGIVMGTAFLMLTAGERRWWPVLLGVGLGFWVPAILLALTPVNIFHGWGGPRSRAGGYPQTSDLNIVQRRVLVALYQPINRRSAFLMVMLTSAVWLLGWQAGLRLGFRPFPVAGLRPSEVLVGCFILSLITAVWTGLFGLTRQIRANWDQIVSEGAAWPDHPEFPGPWREAVRSFFTGRLPKFVTRAADAPA